MTTIDLVPGHRVEAGVLASLQEALPPVFGLPVRRRPAFEEPADAYDPRRHQHSAPALLHAAAEQLAPGALRLLAVTERDIFIPMLSFIFGQAQLGGRVALISLARLRPEYYDLPADPPRLRRRARKEAIHELGHTFGLTHCLDRRCAMSLSTTIQQVDGKQETLCAACRALLRERARAARQALEPSAGEEIP